MGTGLEKAAAKNLQRQSRWNSPCRKGKGEEKSIFKGLNTWQKQP